MDLSEQLQLLFRNASSMAMSCQHRIALAHLIPADVLWSFAPHSPFTSLEDNQIPRCEGLIVVLLPPIALCISPSRKQCQCSVRNVPRTATLPRSPLGADGAPVVARRKQGRTIIIEHVRSWRCSNASGGASLGDRRDVKDATPWPSSRLVAQAGRRATDVQPC